MKTMQQKNMIIADRIEYEFTKMDITDFARLSTTDKNAQRQKLARLRQSQINRNPKLYA